MVLRRLLIAVATLTAADAPRPLPNLPLPTCGGLQVWADVAWRSGWRIQRHGWTGHHRLLDPRQVRRAWGSRAACDRALAARAPAPSRRRVVIVLHGLGRTRWSMARLARAIAREGDEVALLSWPTTRAAMPVHAEALRSLIADLGPRPIAIVTHSLGALAVRHALAGGPQRWPGIQRVAMLFPPNRGARAADLAARCPLLRVLLGEGLAAAATARAAQVPPLTVPGVVIAGACGDGRGWNPLLAGDDDLIVRLDETSLPGSERVVVRAIHTTGMDAPVVRAAVAHALATATAPR